MKSGETCGTARYRVCGWGRLNNSIILYEIDGADYIINLLFLFFRKYVQKVKKYGTIAGFMCCKNTG